MKKFAVVLVFVLIFISWSLAGETKENTAVQEADLDLLGRAFAATGALAGNAELYAWSVISTTYYSPRQAEAAVEAMAEVFELHRDEYTVFLRSTGHYGYAIMDYDLADSVTLRIQVQSLDKETVASIEIRQTNHRGLSSMYEKISQALLTQGVTSEDVNITSCLEGYMNARLRSSEILNTVYSTFKAVDAKYQEGVEANGVKLWNGWSPLFTQSVSSGHDEINFGIAFRPESGGQKTIVRIATPVLPGSY